MSYRRSILKQLREFNKFEPAPDAYLDANAMRCSKKQRGKTEVRKALDQLLQERPVQCVGGEEGAVLIRLNPEKMDQVNAELAWDWRWIVATILGVLGVAVALLQWLRP